LNDWEAAGEPRNPDVVRARCAEATADKGLRFDTVCAAVEAVAQVPGEGQLSEAMTGFLWQLTEQARGSVAEEDPGPWARQALLRLKEWIGSGIVDEGESAWRQSRVGRALATAIQQVAKQWDVRLAERLGEVTFCRQRLRHVRESLEMDAEAQGDLEHELTPSSTPMPSPENYWDAIRESGTVDVVLPGAAHDLESCARQFVDGL